MTGGAILEDLSVWPSQGLLAKDFRRRLGWPKLLDHPFLTGDPSKQGIKPQQQAAASSRRCAGDTPFCNASKLCYFAVVFLGQLLQNCLKWSS